MLSFFAAAGLDTIVLCASGIASLIAMELMDRHPEYLAGVFLLNPVLNEAHLRRKPPYLSRSNTTAINILGYAQRKALAEMKSLFLSPGNIEEAVFLQGRQGLDRQGRKAASSFFEHADPRRFTAYAEAMRRFAKPLHIRQGDFDPLFSDGSLDRIQADFPGARTTLIGDCGHFFALEAPSRLADILMTLGRESW
jgi:pimeloyl-ACP methyl ester carboxylesterase